MSKSPRPEGTPWMTPLLFVNDIDAAIEFYQKAFGFEKIHTSTGEDGSTLHAELKYQGQMLMLGNAAACDSKILPPRESSVACPIILHVYCQNVDQFYQDAINAGAKSTMEPEDTFWGDRMCQLEDPNGYVWSFATYTNSTK